MKTIVKFYVAGCLVFACFNYADAQSSARSSREVNIVENNAVDSIQTAADTATTEYRSERGIPTPPYIEKLLADGKISEALNEFNKFKVAQQRAKANPYHLLYCEMTIYQQAQMGDPTNRKQYEQKADAIRQEIIEKYPNVSDTYILQIDGNTPDDKVVELATKAIELDLKNTGAYDYRGRALFKLGKTKEACADFEKLPWKGDMPEYWPCKDLK